jgi:hypothetical protein
MAKMTIPNTYLSARKVKTEKKLTQQQEQRQQQQKSCHPAVPSTTPMKTLPQRSRTKSPIIQQELTNSTAHPAPATGIEPGTSSITVVVAAAALLGRLLRVGLGTAAPAAAAAVVAWRRGIGLQRRHQQQWGYRRLDLLLLQLLLLLRLLHQGWGRVGCGVCWVGGGLLLRPHHSSSSNSRRSRQYSSSSSSVVGVMVVTRTCLPAWLAVAAVAQQPLAQ